MKFLLNYLTKITFFCVYSRKAHEKKKNNGKQAPPGDGDGKL